MSKHACVTLHRPPPLTRTFESSLLDLSKIVMVCCGYCAAQFIAAKNPAAPPPMMAIFFGGEEEDIGGAKIEGENKLAIAKGQLAKKEKQLK